MRIDDVTIPRDRPVLIAGPTASGKSALALRIAEAEGGLIVNADAIQVYCNWRILTARPGVAEEARAPHRLFGHIGFDQPYSVGDWLREVAPLVASADRLIIVGGTGLYFTALTEGLARIPEIPAAVRAKGDRLRGAGGLDAMIAALDEDTRNRIDLHNPMRVQRAWEVLRATRRGLAEWQDSTPPPILPLADSVPLLLEADKSWLSPRIGARVAHMVAAGVLEEARDNLAGWHPDLPSAKAIGASELIAHLRGEMGLDEALDAITIATRQYAKRQRTWFRGRMTEWTRIDPAGL